MGTWVRSLLFPSPFRKGCLVEVRSAEEIAATLDDKGSLNGLPFMPEMALLCGRRFQVHRHVVKTCVEGLGLRRLSGAVLLEGARCDGAAHDGCQRGCLMFWAEAWLKVVDHNSPARADGALAASEDTADRARAELGARLPTRQGDRYFCQSTELARATAYLSPWNFANFLVEMRHGELSFASLVRIVARTLADRLRVKLGYREIGSLAGPGTSRSKGDLGLAAGEVVTVKAATAIASTLDPKGRNRGLQFEPDMVAFTGGTYRVQAPVRRIILEETGRMVELTSTVALDGVTCTGLCAKNCPRANPLFWREAWLDRRASAGKPAVVNAPHGAKPVPETVG